jgi:hypothetical protein
MLDEKNCKSKINALAYQDWRPLLALIPEIENTSKFGEWRGGGRNKEGAIMFPYSVSAPVVHKFLEIIYAIPIVINFDWGSWDEGREIAGNEGFDFDAVDCVTKCKLITAIARSDRFCEGALVSAFESGLILKILKSIEKEVISKGKADQC